jgi:hypothetical protein
MDYIIIQSQGLKSQVLFFIFLFYYFSNLFIQDIEAHLGGQGNGWGLPTRVTSGGRFAWDGVGYINLAHSIPILLKNLKNSISLKFVKRPRTENGERR